MPPLLVLATLLGVVHGLPIHILGEYDLSSSQSPSGSPNSVPVLALDTSAFSGRDIQQLVIGAGIAGKSVAARSAAAAALYDSASLLQLPSVSHWRPGNLQAALAPVSGSGDFAEAVAAAQAGGAHLLLVALAGDQPAAPVQFDAAACKDSDRTGLRVTASILEGLGVTLMLSIFTALGLAALYCIATPTRLLEKNVPVGREH